VRAVLWLQPGDPVLSSGGNCLLEASVCSECIEEREKKKQKQKKEVRRGGGFGEGKGC
jgi:hypothetical protein